MVGSSRGGGGVGRGVVGGGGGGGGWGEWGGGRGGGGGWVEGGGGGAGSLRGVGIGSPVTLSLFLKSHCLCSGRSDILFLFPFLGDVVSQRAGHGNLALAHRESGLMGNQVSSVGMRGGLLKRPVSWDHVMDGGMKALASVRRRTRVSSGVCVGSPLLLYCIFYTPFPVLPLSSIPSSLHLPPTRTPAPAMMNHWHVRLEPRGALQELSQGRGEGAGSRGADDLSSLRSLGHGGNVWASCT